MNFVGNTRKSLMGNPMRLFLLFIFGGLFVFLSHIIHHSRAREVVKRYYSPPPQMEFLHFGMKYLMSDLLWLRALMDFDYCEHKDPFNQRNCQEDNWLFRVIATALKLDPWYRFVYQAGGVGLSVVISDVKGASQVFNQGIRYYPEHWKILYLAAYHATYEEKNRWKAARLMEQAARHGAPAWVFDLAGKLYQEQGDRELIIRILKDAAAFNLSPEIVKSLQERLTSK
ncbi:MAG: hypothetical protein NZ480_01050 [Bdellovibrionaceae bacterium]|nr:hypothetical protein [Pseudobdellovibrionaceae bacterium]MDW8189938.1 hypothetical protein [Pseudobdellovibrionaceae bacterium]